MKTLKKQNGLSMWGWLFVGSMFIALVYQGIKLMGPYSNYLLVSKVLEDIPAKHSRKEVKTYIQKRVDLENITGFSVKDNVKTETTRNGYKIIVNYEQRVNVFNSLDFVVVFYREVERDRSS